MKYRLFAALFLLLFAARSFAQGAPARDLYDYYGHGPYRKLVPKPSAILGYEAGETHTTFRDQERVIQAIAGAAKDRVRVVDYGRSVEGRPLRLILVSTPENLAKLDTIRGQVAKLADPRTVANDAEAEKIVQSTPVLTWINECIHGDETASFEAGMWTLYTLAASDAADIQEALRKSVIIINPVFNPDGHERFVVHYNSVAVGSPERFALESETPWAARGRFNHYRFDMNRDKLAQSQPETRQESAAFLSWHPQVYVDQHGQVENYFFPPNSMSVHRQTGRERMAKWTDIFGRSNAAEFDRRGWQYVTRETFDFFGPFYLDSWASLAGAIGMTYETDAGGRLSARREDQTIITLRDGIAHHVESALATIVAASRNRESLLRDFLAYRREAIKAGQTERMKRIVLSPGNDPGRSAELAALLTHVGIEVREATAEFTSASAHGYMDPSAAGNPNAEKAGVSHTFPAGSLIVEMAQPHGRMARAFLEPDTDFEPEFMKEQLARKEANEKKNENERKESYDFYDITAWSLPYAYGLTAHWTEDAPAVQSKLLVPDAKGEIALSGRSGGVQGVKAPVAYLWRYDRDASAFLALRLLQEGFRLGVVTKPIKMEGREWPRGTMLARVSRNSPALADRVSALSKELGVDVLGVASGYGEGTAGGLGSGNIDDVKRPSIAVVGGDGVSHTGFGSVWYLLEKQAGLKFTTLSMRGLGSADLSRFNVIILPDGFSYGGALGKAGADTLREWVNRGGALIGLAGGGQWFSGKEIALTSAQAVGADDDAKPAEKSGAAAKPDEKAKKNKPIDLAGAIFRANVDTTHFLGYGYEGTGLAVPLSGSTFLKGSTKGANVVTFGKENLTLSGFVWPDNTERLLAGTSYVIDEPAGSGHVLLFLEDPTFRSFWIGLRKMFLSGILFAPSRVPLAPVGVEG